MPYIGCWQFMLESAFLVLLHFLMPELKQRGEAEASTGGASSRVSAYLDAELERLQHDPEGRLPSVRKIAGHLGVSTATVYHVFKAFAREGKIRPGAGRQGTRAVSQQSAAQDARLYTLGLCTGLPESLDRSGDQSVGGADQFSPWRTLLSHAFLSAASQSEHRAMLLSLTINPTGGGSMYEHLAQARDTVQGLIMVAHPEADQAAWERLTAYYEEVGKPVICIGPAGLTETSNFVAVNFLTACSTLARGWYEEGRRRILYILSGSFHCPTAAPTRYMGLQYGVSEAGGNASECVTYAVTPNASIDSGYESIKALIAATGTAPDAVFSGDFQCLGAIKALREEGILVPEQTSVVGCTGVDLTGTNYPDLTRFLQPYDRVAGTALDLLIQRIENDGRNVPGIYLDCNLLPGNTTTTRINRMLEAQIPAERQQSAHA